MKDATRKIISAALAADGSVPPSVSKSALVLLDGGTGGAWVRPVGRLMRVSEVAKLAGVSSRTVRNWCRDGLLVPVRGPAPRFVMKGCTESSVRALLEGVTAETERGRK